VSVDQAYGEIACPLEHRLQSTGLVILDAVYGEHARDIERRWEGPHADVSMGGGPAPIIAVETSREPRIIGVSEPSWLADRLRAVFSKAIERA